MLNDLTEDELHACLRMECDTLRRESVIDELVSEMINRHTTCFINNLKEKYQCLAKSLS